MKRLLIILAFLPLFGFGQLSPDSAWYSGYVVEGVDTFLQNNSSSTAIHQLQISNINGQEANINAGYLTGSIKINGQPWRTIYSNANYADTTFTLFEAHTLDSDLTEILPYRITKIYIYNIAATGGELTAALDTFNVPTYNSGALEVGSGKTYATITLGIAAAIDDDTLYIHQGTYVENVIVSGKDLTLIFVGDATITPASGTALRFLGANLYNRVYNAQINSAGLGVQISSTETNGLFFNNCDIIGSNSVYGVGITAELHLQNSRIEGQINHGDKLIINECLIDRSSTSNIRMASGIDSCNINYSQLNGSSANIFDFDVDVSVNVFNSALNDGVFLSQSLSLDIDYTSEHCEYTSSVTMINVTTLDSMTMSFSNDNFELNYNGTMFNIENQNNITIDSCTFISDYIMFLTITGNKRNTVSVSNSTFESDSGIAILVIDNILNFTDNYVEAGNDAVVRARGKSIDNIPAYIARNTLITKGNSSEGGEFIGIGNENDTDSDGKLDATIVEDNICIGPRVYGNETPTGHGIFNYANQSLIQYNVIKGRSLAYVDKNRGETYNSIYFANQSIECNTGFTIKGSPNTLLYNNAVYIDTITDATSGFNFTYDNVYAGSFSDSCTMINNIVHNSGSNAANACLRFANDEDTIGFTSNNNIYFRGGVATNEVEIELIDKTFDQWQALGFDANSFNTDPNLSSSTELWPVWPSNAIGGGYNLGSEYIHALDISSVWPDNIVYKNQIVPWTIGAYQVTTPNIGTRNNGVWIYNGAGGVGTIFLR